MNTNTPIACSLTAAEMPQRLAELSAIGRDGLLAVNEDGVMRFRGDEGTRERLEAIVAAESRCCAFLEFDLREDYPELVLAVHAPEGAEPLVRELVSAFATEAKLA